MTIPLREESTNNDKATHKLFLSILCQATVEQLFVLIELVLMDVSGIFWLCSTLLKLA